MVYVPEVLGHATVEPVITPGVLKLPRILKHFVLVTPQPFCANTQISQFDTFAGIAPSVNVAFGVVVVAEPFWPLTRVPALTLHLYSVAPGTVLQTTLTVCPTQPDAG